MASLNPFRRKRTVLVASATNIKLGDSDIVASVMKRRQEWQTRAIDVTEVVGEIGFGVGENSDLLAQIPIFAAELPTNQEDKPTRTSNAAAKQAIEDLGNFTQRAELQRQLALHLQVTGEAFLVGIQPGPGRKNTELLWDIASITETSVIDIPGPSGPVKTIKLEGWTDEGKDLILSPFSDPPDVFIRIWRPSLRRKQLATSHVRSVLGASEELLWWDAASVAAAKNRMTMAGLWGIPSNIELPAESEQDARLSGSQRFINRILKSMMIAISNPAAAEAAAPILFTYPYNEKGVSGIELIEPTRPRDELLERRTDRCLLRIAQGLNLPMEVISGEGGANHWGAGQIEECLVPETKVLTADLRWVEVGSLQEGDELAGFDENPPETHPDRNWKTSRVEKAGRAELDCYEVTMADGTKFTASANHQWLMKPGNHKSRWVTTQYLYEKQSDEWRSLGPKTGILKVVEPWKEDNSWEAGYLAGVFDGEGYVSSGTPFCLGFGQRDNVVLEQTLFHASTMGFNFKAYGPLSSSVNGGVFDSKLMGGVRELMRFLGIVRPYRLFEKWQKIGGVESLGRFKGEAVPVVSVVPVGKREVVTLKTSTGTLIAEGFAHHNSQFRKHVQPLAVLLVNALTIAYLHPVLRAQNIDPSKYVIWFDASSLIVNQNKTRDVIRAYELGEANGDALRREIGLTEGDKPTPEERAQTIEFLQALKGANNDREGVIPDPKKSPEQDMKDPNAVPERNTPGSRTPVEQPAAPLKGKGQSPITSAASVLNGHTDELLLAMQVTCDEKVRAALTKAGSRLRSRANKVPAYKESIRGLPSEAIAATLGREAVIKLGINDLFDDCFNAVHSRLVFHASAHLPITTDFSSATTYLVTQLRNIAAERLFDPPTDEYLVPISVISDSIRRLAPPPVPT